MGKKEFLMLQGILDEEEIDRILNPIEERSPEKFMKKIPFIVQWEKASSKKELRINRQKVDHLKLLRELNWMGERC